jgi:hypothetical protein
MELNKALGLNGLLWNFIRPFRRSLRKIYGVVYPITDRGTTPLKLNFGVPTLLPKKENEVQIQQFKKIMKLATYRVLGLDH